jgi:hypothetical protein
MAQGFLFAPAIKVGPFRDLAQALNGGDKPQATLPAAATVAA